MSRSRSSRPSWPKTLTVDVFNNETNVHQFQQLCEQTGRTKFRTRDLDGRGKDVFFVLDVSGSMEGKRLNAARSLCIGLYNTLFLYDRFAFTAFSDGVYPKVPLRPMWRGRETLEGDKGNMKTELANVRLGSLTSLWDAIDKTLDNIRSTTRPTKVVVLTDGVDNNSGATEEDIRQKISTLANVEMLLVKVGDGASIGKAFKSMRRSKYIQCKELNNNVGNTVLSFIKNGLRDLVDEKGMEKVMKKIQQEIRHTNKHRSQQPAASSNPIASSSSSSQCASTDTDPVYARVKLLVSRGNVTRWPKAVVKFNSREEYDRVSNDASSLTTFFKENHRHVGRGFCVQEATILREYRPPYDKIKRVYTYMS